jgi:hypothetical protein
MRPSLRNPGVIIALVLLALVLGAAVYFLGHEPHTPDAFTGHVYPLSLRPVGVVYLTDVEHDLLGIGFFAAVAVLLVGVGLRGVIAQRRR